MVQHDLFLSSIIDLAERNKNRLPDSFLKWLRSNEHVYRAFEREALTIWSKGHKHYGARTIIEWMRHNMAIREVSSEPWILNDHNTPYLARLFIIDHPQCAGLFEMRKSKKVFTEGVG
jgi:chaperone required for assembly of F1-ATPase